MSRSPALKLVRPPLDPSARVYLVLCIYAYSAIDPDDEARILCSTAGIMIEVQRSSEVLTEFKRAMFRRLSVWRPAQGPRPYKWSLVKYTTATGWLLPT